MTRIRCFVVEPADHYTPIIGVMEDGPCMRLGNRETSLHSARVELPARAVVDDEEKCPSIADASLPWPTHCECGHEFTEAANRYSGADRKYRRPDTGEEFALRDAPPGALWRATWYEDNDKNWCGADGQAWVCQTPGGSWHIDGRANNCAKPDDHTHRCWVREGVAPDFNVSKNGNTCSAGAGSILCGGYHGFLRNGYLESC